MPVLLGSPGFRPTTSGLTLYDHTWHPVPCPIQRRPSGLIYLGVLLDHHISGNALHDFNTIYQSLTTLVTHLLDQPASTKLKLDYIHFKIIPIIVAQAICSNWTLKLYRQLDKPLTRAYRLLLGLPRGFPDALHYLPHDMGGIGLPRLSDRIQVAKWTTILRCDARGGATRQTVKQLLYRIPVTATDVTTSMTAIHFLPPDTKPQRPLLCLSLVQWFHESGLRITKRIAHGVIPQSTTPSPTTSTVAFAEAVRTRLDTPSLSPSAATEVLYVSTDGSYHPMPDTIRTCFADKPPHPSGSGAAAVVFHFSNQITPLALRVTQPPSTAALSPFLWELLAHTIAIRILSHLQLTVPILSDCRAAIARTTDALLTASIASKPHGSTTLTQLTSRTNPTSIPSIQFVRSHPERTNTRTNTPSPYDKAIYIADRVADRAITSCQLGRCVMPVDTITTTSTTLVNDLIPLDLYYVCSLLDPVTPVFNDYMAYQHYVHHRSVLTRRDESADTYTEYWRVTHFAFANYLHPLPSPSYWQAARRCQIDYDKVAHGRNRSKMAKTLQMEQQLSQCSYCSKIDNQEHYIHECTHPCLREPRRQIIQRLHAAAKPLLRHKNKVIRTFTQNFLYMATHYDRGLTRRAWLGLWSPTMVERLFRRTMSLDVLLTSSQVRQLKATARTLSRPLREGYFLLLRTAQEHIPMAACTDQIRLPTSSTTRRHLETTFPESITTSTPSDASTSINRPITNFSSTHNAFDISNVAFLRTDYDSDSRSTDRNLHTPM